jgi:ABC-2 type transport system permease protein
VTGNWWELTALVARREIRQRARARSFWIASVLLLIAVAAGAIIPGLVHGHHSAARVGIVGRVTAAVTATVRQAGQISATTVTVVPLPDLASAKAGLRSGSLNAVLIGDSEVLVEQQPVTGASSPGATLVGALSQVGGLQKLYSQLPPAPAAGLARRGIALPVQGLTPPPRGLASRLTGLAVAILIYVIILTYGVRITIGVGEEKASRVVEVLLTTLRPTQLLAGKVIGMGLLALGQITVMVATYLLLGRALGSEALRGAAAGVVLAGALWLMLGYAFYCTAYAAAGSLITRQSDAYNASLPLQLPLIFAYILAYTVLYASGVSWFYHLLAFIPFTAPVAMPVLVAVGAAPAWQMGLSAAISLAATVGMARLAGTIYERAILRTGSRLKIRQALRSAR